MEYVYIYSYFKSTSFVWIDRKIEVSNKANIVSF